MAFLSYSAAGLLHGSGFLAVYLTASLDRQRPPCPIAAPRWLLPKELHGWPRSACSFCWGCSLAQLDCRTRLLPALFAGVVLTFLARPLSVALSALPFRWGWREQAVLSWAGLRGAVPIVLATIPLTSELDGAQRIFDIVFVLVVVYTLSKDRLCRWWPAGCDSPTAMTSAK